jgi:WG containing repeat
VKNAFLLLALLAFSVVLKAQNDTSIRIKIDSFVRGGDSVRYTIRGADDTIQITQLFRSGRISAIDWKTDSSYNYDVFGQILNKNYTSDNANLAQTFDTYNYRTGLIEKRIINTFNGTIIQNLDLEGNLETIEETHNSVMVQRIKKMNKYGQIISSTRIDTLKKNGEIEETIMINDTLFYSNGRICKLRNEDTEGEHSVKYFNRDGTLYPSDFSEREKAIVFKDNLDCFYGFKNSKGDTIVKPLYEKIEKLGETLWAAENNGNIHLYYLDGTRVNRHSYSYLFHLKTKGRDRIVDTLTKYIHETLPIENLEYFYFYDGNNMGVIDDQGNVALKPVPYDLKHICIDGKYFKFTKYSEKGYQKGYLDRNGKPLFDKKYNNVFSAYCEDYFYLNNDDNLTYTNSYDEEIGYEYGDGGSISFDDFDGKPDALFGLGKADGTVLLKPKYCGMQNPPYTTLFITSSEIKKGSFKEQDMGELGKEGSKWVNHGVYDARTQRWLLNQKGLLVQKGQSYLYIKDIARKKYGLMDFEGVFILPIVYDTIILNQNIGLGQIKKDGFYQLFNIENGKAVVNDAQYDYLDEFTYENDWQSNSSPYRYFLAKRKDKWGIIDGKDKVIMPFEYDEASAFDSHVGKVLLVKKDKAYAYTFESLPNEVFPYDHMSHSNIYKNWGSYELSGETPRTIVIDDTGKVLVPPQYKVLHELDSKMVLVKNEQNQKKIFLLESGKTIDYPFDYDIITFNDEMPYLVVENKADTTLGIVSKEGKMIIPCQNYGLSLPDDKTFTFFVKKDPPYMKSSENNKIKVSKDTLILEDQKWKMYDAQGQLLSQTDFNFPIPFYKGVGVGMQNRVANLYKTDGTLLRPFNIEGVSIDKSIVFDNIRCTVGTVHYVFYYRQGLTPMMMVTDHTGKIIVEGGRYETISPFYGKYALVRMESKIGLIDKAGKEIVAPQDLRTYKKQFVDSLRIDNTLIEFNNKNLTFQFPIHFITTINETDKDINPDSLNIDVFQKASLWNLFIEQCPNFIDGTQTNILRASIFAPYDYFYDTNGALKTPNILEVAHVNVFDSIISFAKGHIWSESKPISIDKSFNYHYQNGRWQDIKLKDLLFLQSEKRQKLNNIVAQKIKNLQDAFIDCSDPSNFLKQVEDKWLVNKEGVSFYFDSRKDSFTRSKIVLLTWEELSPFLKIKIKD